MLHYKVGYYAHHMGSGHATRAHTILSNWDIPSVLLTSYPTHNFSDGRYGTIPLPEDHAHLSNFVQSKSPIPEVLHHAPLGIRQIRERMAIVSNFFETEQPNLFITDVSIELTLFARLCSVPCLAVRLTGLRNDLPHTQAFQSAQALIFPLPEIFEHEDTPKWVRKKTLYTGGFCRHTGQNISMVKAREYLKINQSANVVLFTNGQYDQSNKLCQIIAIAKCHPAKQFFLIGKYWRDDNLDLPKNIHFVGHVKNTYPYLRAANIVVGSCGNNTMLEVAHAKRPFICLPEDRPFGEQISKAKTLEKYNLAAVAYEFPSPSEFKSLLEKARSIHVTDFADLFDHQPVKTISKFVKQTIVNNKPKSIIMEKT